MVCMIKKCFILTQFGEPHSWTNEYFENVSRLGKYGWSWKIFTPNTYKKIPTNVEIIPMTADQFNNLVANKVGVRPQMFVTNMGVPSVHVTDFCVAWGKVFEDYLKGFEFWGIPNWDIVYGRLERFLPDIELEDCDVWSDDVNTINGIFTLFRNRDDINVLFKEIPNWREKFAQKPCPRCLGVGTQHTLFGTDEYDMTNVMRELASEGLTRFKYPLHYPLHSHDRLEQHFLDVKLELKKDGSLWELFEDMNPPNWIHSRKFLGKEIAYFHFLRTKKWPL